MTFCGFFHLDHPTLRQVSRYTLGPTFSIRFLFLIKCVRAHQSSGEYQKKKVSLRLKGNPAMIQQRENACWLYNRTKARSKVNWVGDKATCISVCRLNESSNHKRVVKYLDFKRILVGRLLMVIMRLTGLVQTELKGPVWKQPKKLLLGFIFFLLWPQFLVFSKDFSVIPQLGDADRLQTPVCLCGDPLWSSCNRS